MSDSRSRNTWWRYVPQSHQAGVLGVCLWSVVLLIGVVLLFTTTYHSPVAEALQILASVLFAWCLLRSITGLMAVRRDTPAAR